MTLFLRKFLSLGNFLKTLTCGLMWILCAPIILAQDVVNEVQTPSITANDTMIVLDGSGSMWGQIEGEAKISIAKTVVRNILTEWDNDIGLGLIAYGHRREGDCGDIETLVPVATGTADSVSTKIKALNPKGKTPITQSLRQAATALKYKENGATVILVSDGLETCGADPCALAKELEASGVDFTAHIVGFGLKAEEFEALQCIATETGGEYFTANSADELTGALKTTVEAAKTTGPKGLKVFAAACDDCAPYKGVAFLWSVYALDDEDNKTGDAIQTGSTQGYHVPLAPGRYFLEGQLDYNKNLRQSQIIELDAEGVTQKTLIIPAGLARLNAYMTPDGDEIKSNMRYSFQSAENEEGKRVTYTTANYRADPIWLPAGEVLAIAIHGKAEVKQTVMIAANESTDIRFDMNIGHLHVSARLTDADPLLNGSTINVYTENAETGTRKKIDYAARQKVGRFILSEGDYIVTSTSGNATGTALASVERGERTEATITIDAGKAKLLAGFTEGEPVGGTLWEVLDETGKRVTLSSTYPAVLTLNAGRYTAIVSRKYRTVGRADFEVKVGETTDVFIVIPKS